MKKPLRITLFALICTIISAGIASAGDQDAPPAPKFTTGMIACKTMASSGFPQGAITFNKDGSMTCANYPAFVTCKSWEIQKDGSLARDFTDSHTGKDVEVRAFWKLLKQSGDKLEVSQTSSNTDGAHSVTITVQ